MAKQTVVVRPENTEHEVEVKPLTLIVPSADMAGSNMEYPGRFPISPQDTIYHADRVQKLHDEFYTYWHIFHDNCGPDHPPDHSKPTPDEFRQGGMGKKHMMGLIDLLLKLQDKGVAVVLKYPETYLHPAWAVGLGDLLLSLKDRANGNKIVTKAQ